MRIALFSDIHANLPALEAVLADIDRRKPDAIYCLGDLVGYNAWPNEVVDLIRGRGIPTVAGNYDFGIGRSSDDCGCAYKTDEEKANGAVSIARTNELVRDDQRAYLRTLPAHIRVEHHLNHDRLDLLLVHGSPRKINEYLFEDRDEKSMMRILEGANADILCFGHTHKPFHRVFAYERDGRTAYRHAINIGSVGKPKDSDPRACYVELDIPSHLSVLDPDALGVSFIRVPYDVEKAATGVMDVDMPAYYAEALRKAR
ncbi:MAG: metallophosphoesterase family protein [Flavobacteriales bacterium]|nr:MAG: metallophosphoesterase family protein [Flavobacteriales bacterium]